MKEERESPELDYLRSNIDESEKLMFAIAFDETRSKLFNKQINILSRSLFHMRIRYSNSQNKIVKYILRKRITRMENEINRLKVELNNNL